MAAPVLLRHRKLLTSLYSRFSSTSEGLPSNPRKSGIFQYLSSHFYDIESIVEISQKLKRWKMEKGNKYDADLHQRYGNDIGAAIFVLKLHGGIRFQDQMDWCREDPNQKESIDFLDYCGKPLEAIDLSASFISYIGLKNFGVSRMLWCGCALDSVPVSQPPFLLDPPHSEPERCETPGPERMPPRRQLVPGPAVPLWGVSADLVFGRLSPDHGERAALPPPLQEFGTLGCLQPPFRFSSALNPDSPGRNVAPVLHCGNGRPGEHGLSHRTRKRGDFTHAQQDLHLNQNGQN